MIGAGMELKCVICDKDAGQTKADYPDTYLDPSRSLIFAAAGNFGSRIFDPTGWDNRGPRLIALICDDCVTERISSFIVDERRYQRTIHEYRIATDVEDLPER